MKVIAAGVVLAVEIGGLGVMASVIVDCHGNSRLDPSISLIRGGCWTEILWRDPTDMLYR